LKLRITGIDLLYLALYALISLAGLITLFVVTPYGTSNEGVYSDASQLD
jgi:hypothetical protein